jgi:general secretion pathway protein A
MMMCAYSEDRPFIDPFDLKGIRKDLLGEDDTDELADQKPSRQRPKKDMVETKQPKRHQNEAEADSSQVLLRIAEALESIDRRLSQMTSDPKDNEDRYSTSSNVKPLAPGRK